MEQGITVQEGSRSRRKASFHSWKAALPDGMIHHRSTRSFRPSCAGLRVRRVGHIEEACILNRHAWFITGLGALLLSHGLDRRVLAEPPSDQKPRDEGQVNASVLDWPDQV